MAGRQDIKAGSAYVELLLKGGAKFRAGLGSSLTKLKDFSKAAIAAGAVIGAATVGAFAAATKSFLDTGDALDKMRQRTGISVEALSKLEHAAGQSGASLADVENGVRKMQREIGKAGPLSAEMADALTSLGLTLEDLQKLSPEDQFNTIAARIKSVEDPTKRAAAAMQFFGKSGTKLLPMIEDLDKLKAEAEDMGFVMSGEAAASAVRLGDKLANLWKSVKFGALALGEALAPAIEAAVDKVQSFATSTIKIIQAMAVDWRLGGQIAAAGLRLGLLQGIASLSQAVGGAMGEFMGTLGRQIVSGDFSQAFSTALTGIADLWAGFSEGLVAVFTQAMRAVTSAWESTTQGISDWILANPGIAKLALIGTGVDLAAEFERSRQLDAQRGVQGDPLAEAQRIAREALTAQSDAFRGQLDQIDRDAQARTRNAADAMRNRTAGGISGLSDAVARAQAEFDALLAKAAALRDQTAQQEAARRDEALAGAGEMAAEVAAGNGPKNQVTGTFSASAAAAIGRGGSEDIRLSRRQVALLEILAKFGEQQVRQDQLNGAML